MGPERDLSAIRARLAKAARRAALTGAGISAESGVPTFRGPDGLWRSFRPEELATPEAFERDPRFVWEWYAWRRERVGACAPNAGHEALARAGIAVVTQNVDGLHRRAGSDAIDLHGSLWRVRCTGCGQVRSETRVPLPEVPPRCPSCDALERPDIVWFGEPLDPEVLRRAAERVCSAQVVLVVGTSGVVYPAAGLCQTAWRQGAYVIEINPEPTPLSETVSAIVRAPAAEALPMLL